MRESHVQVFVNMIFTSFAFAVRSIAPAVGSLEKVYQSVRSDFARVALIVQTSPFLTGNSANSSRTCWSA